MQGDPHGSTKASPTPTRASRWKSRVARYAIALVCLYRFAHHFLPPTDRDESAPDARRGAFNLPVEVIQSLGPYSPWYAVDKYVPWGDECEVMQVNIVCLGSALFECV